MTNKIKMKDVTFSQKCDNCSSLCCTYITQALDTPRSMNAFDVLLWQLAHEGVHIFKDSTGWYLLYLTRCQFLVDNRCSIYDNRPLICREHSNESCELDAGVEHNCEMYFKYYHELDNYCRKKYKTWDNRFDKKRKKEKKKKRKKEKKKKRKNVSCNVIF